MGYKFSDRFLTLNIEDKDYRVNMDIKAAKQAQEVLAGLKADGVQDATVVGKAIDDALEALIGKGAAGAIFRGREFNLVEHLDVMVYVYNEAAKHCQRLADVCKA